MLRCVLPAELFTKPLKIADDTIGIMTKKNKIILLAAVVISVAALAVAAGFWVPRMLDPETHRAALIQHLKTALNRDVRFARGEVSLWLRPTFTFTNILIKEKDAQTTFITADRLHFRLALLPLLRKKVVLQDDNRPGIAGVIASPRCRPDFAALHRIQDFTSDTASMKA